MINKEPHRTNNVNKPNKFNTYNPTIQKKSLQVVNELSSSKRNKIFIMFLLADLFLNYDSGAIPVSLLEIAKEINLGYKEQSSLSFLVHLGLSFASLFTSPIFSKIGATKVLLSNLLLNSICCFIFSLTQNKFLLFSSRFFMGVTEAFLVVYGPIWVNCYSPKDKSTTWMGILHSCTVFGMICGYIISGIIINFFKKFLNWRFAIQIQGIALIPIALMFYFEKEEYININLENDQKRFNLTVISVNNPIHSMQEREMYNNNNSFDLRNISNVPHSDNIGENSILPQFSEEFSHPGLINQAIIILSNTLYVTVTFGLCTVYFIVSGIQFWITAYMIQILEANPISVVIAFSFTSATAPLLGVLIGGTIADKFGGYKGKNTYKAIKIIVAFGFISFVFAFPLLFLFSFLYFTVLLWVFLFFGGTIVPIATGIMLSAIKLQWQATSSSLSQLIFNFGGYFLSPFLTGFIMDCFEDEKEGFLWGIRVIFGWVIFAVIFFGSAWLYEYHNQKKNTTNDDDDESEEMKEAFSQFIRLEIRRHIAQSIR